MTSVGSHILVTVAMVAGVGEGTVLSHLLLWRTYALTLGAPQFQHPPGALGPGSNQTD